jgi:hypothetical protein
MYMHDRCRSQGLSVGIQNKHRFGKYLDYIFDTHSKMVRDTQQVSMGKKPTSQL